MRQSGSTVDPADVERFSAAAADWWEMRGSFAPLHRFTPVRMALIREWLSDHFDLEEDAAMPFAGISILDVGCGGGLLSEPMARLGAAVTGIDASRRNVEVARDHAALSGLVIDYRAVPAERLAEEQPDRFDAIVASEVIEHVADTALFAAALSRLLRPGGALVVTTLNRTAKSMLLAKLAAEYVLGWVPRGTHDWRQFLKPEELTALLEGAGLAVADIAGITYEPLAGRFRRSNDRAVNYALLAVKPAAGV